MIEWLHRCGTVLCLVLIFTVHGITRMDWQFYAILIPLLVLLEWKLFMFRDCKDKAKKYDAEHEAEQGAAND